MKVQVYNAFSGVLIVTAATPRVEAAPSFRFTAAKIHEDFCAKVRGLLREHKHVGPMAEEQPAAKRLSTYFPAFEGKPLFAIRELMPAGSSRDVDEAFQLEVTRIRYQFSLNLLSAFFLAEEDYAEALERHLEKAVNDLFEANGVPNVFIPGDEAVRPGDRTEIDILVEMGPATARTGAEIPSPAQ
jgi:hypothetical protein